MQAAERMNKFLNNFLERVFVKILDLWSYRETAGWAIPVSFLVGLFGICSTIVLIGAVPTFIYGHDIFFLLESGWRVLQHQRPHVDFYSPWGPLILLLEALALKLSNYSVNAVAYGSAIVALIVGLWTYLLGRSRLAPIPAVLLGLYAAILACSPHSLGTTIFQLSHAMTYNRYGYALLIVILVECFQRQDEECSGSREMLGGISTGIALALAFLLKVSYFLVGAGLIVVSLLLWHPSSRRLTGIVLGGMIAMIPGLAFLHFDLRAVMRSLRMAAGARSQTYHFETAVSQFTAKMSPIYNDLGLGIALALAAAFLKPRSSHWLGELYLPVSAVIIGVADLALFSTNMQQSGLPLLTTFAILVASRLADKRYSLPRLASAVGIAYAASILIMASLLVVPALSSDILAVAVAVMREHHLPPSCSGRFRDPKLASLVMCDNDQDPAANGAIYANYINDGEALLQENGTSRDRVLTIDMQNPFPYVLGWPPPHGGIASMSYHTVSAKFHPSFDEYFGDATIVMVPKSPAQGLYYWQMFMDIYGPELHRRFSLAAESDRFWMYRSR